MQFVLDESKILEAIQGTQLPSSVLEEGARLVDHWVGECAELDARDETLAVEAPFYIELDPLTFVVGTEDRIIRRYSDGKVCGCEWKTTKHQTKFWNSDTWLESISEGHQVVTYAAGLVSGVFPFNPSLSFWPEENPEILVRAISKSHPPVIWPSPEGQFLEVGRERIRRTLDVYRNEAGGIRGRQGTARVPWQVPGLHCTNMFRKECEFLGECRKGEGGKWGQWTLESIHQSFSPGSQRVVKYLVEVGKINFNNLGSVVVLSASSLSDLQQCAERWRRKSLVSEGEEEKQEAMSVGTVLHAGVGELYRQMMRGKE